MEIFKELHERMDFFAENIAAEVAEKRYYEVAEIKAIAKTRLWFAISDCLQIQVNDKEAKRNELVKKLSVPGLPQWKKTEIGFEIAKINIEKKEANRLMHTMQDYDEYSQLKFFLKDRFGQEVLTDFTNNYLNRQGNKSNKNIAKHSDKEKQDKNQ